jgi:hypothetical protein
MLTLPEPSQVQAPIESDVASNATTEDEEDLDLSHSSAILSKEQQQIQKIAEQLFTNLKPGVAKPPPSGQPEVWADGRQELCETLTIFAAIRVPAIALVGLHEVSCSTKSLTSVTTLTVTW